MKVSVRDNVAQVVARLQGVKRDVVQKAIPRALNRTTEIGRTAASREMRSDGYAFSASEIKAAISLVKATQGHLISAMRVRRKTKTLMEFSPRQSNDGVSVLIHKTRKTIKHAFIGQLRNGRYGVYIEDKSAGKIILRTRGGVKGKGKLKQGWREYPVRKLYGPSVGGSYASERIQAAMQAVLTETFSDRLAHEIQYLSR